MAVRRPKRDRNGRFAKTAGTAARAAKSATKASARKVTKKVRRAYVPGSGITHLTIEERDGFKQVRVGGDLRLKAGRAARVAAEVGYRGKPDRRLDVKPVLTKPTKTLTVTVKPNPARSASAVKRASAGSKTMRTPSGSTSAVRKVRP